MKKFSIVPFTILLMLMMVTSCKTKKKPITQEDNLPPDFMGIKSVSPMDNDASYDYFMVRWYKAKDNITGGDKITYKIFFKRSETELTPYLAGVATGETLSYIVKIQRQGSNKELLPEYFFQVEAIDEAGNSSVSKIKKAKAQDFHPPKWGYIEEVKEINYQTLKITWSEAEDERTFANHIKYNVFVGTSKINFSYDHPLTTVTGKRESIINFDLSNYQNKTIYFTVVAEDLSGNRNINGVFRELKVGSVTKYNAGLIRSPVNRKFTYDLSQLVKDMNFKIINAPSGTSISGTLLSFVPIEAQTYRFNIEGFDAEGNIAIITFELEAFNPPLEYFVPVKIDYPIVPTSNTLYFYSVTDNSIYSVKLKEKFNTYVFSPSKHFHYSYSPVTFTGYKNYFSFVTETDERFWISVTNITTGEIRKFSDNRKKFYPCPASTYSSTLTTEAITMTNKGIIVKGRGVIEGYDLNFNPVFSIYSENFKQPSINGVIRFCQDGSIFTIGSFPEYVTLESIVFPGYESNYPIMVTDPYKKVVIVTNTLQNLYYSIGNTPVTTVKQIAVSSSGEVYLLGEDGKLFYLLGSSWIEIGDNFEKLLYSGDGNVIAVSSTGVFLLDGLTEPFNILPSECEIVLQSRARTIKTVYIEKTILWLIFPETIYACAR